MKLQRRNTVSIWYQLYEEDSPQTITDEYGNVLETGERGVTYSAPVEIRASVSTATGTVQAELFGGFTDYDKVVIVDDITCPIDEQSVLFIDRVPEYAEGELVNVHDYIVKRIAKSLNFIAYAVRKVEVA
jgi:hypothetical protein